MILDKQAEFADAAAVTTSAVLTNVMDLGDDVTLRNIGGPGAAYLVILVDTAATAAGAATVTFSLESDSTADLATSATVHHSTAAIGKATLVAGYAATVVQLPFGQYERYLGVRATVATGPLTAGAFSAFLTRDPQYWQAMAANNPSAN